MSAGVQAVIFDWGGTLATYATVEISAMWALAARHIATKQNTSIDEEQIHRRLGTVEEEFWARTETDQRSGTLAGIIADAVNQLEIDIAESVLEEAAIHYLNNWAPHIKHDPEAKTTLAALSDRGITVGLLSNTHWPRSFHERFLERDHLASLINARVYTSDLPYMKPHALAFRAALDALDSPQPSRTVFVGDRPYDDVHGARAVGMRTVLRPNPDVPAYAVEPDAVIDHLPELLSLIDRWG